MLSPKIEQVNQNMAIVYAPLSVCPIHDVRDEECKTNRPWRKSLEARAQQVNAVEAES